MRTTDRVEILRADAVGDDFEISAHVCGPRGQAPALVLVATDADGIFGTALEAVESLQLAA